MNEKWDRRFLGLAEYYSTFSKDESTKVGCVVVKRDRSVIASGFNGMPRGVDDDVVDRHQRPEKYFWFEHAERNSIYNSAKNGIALAGSTLYSTLCPCMDCARAIVQVGIKRVVTYEAIPELMKTSDRWNEHFKRSLKLFRECGVQLALY